jgi:hypothetical protein
MVWKMKVVVVVEGLLRLAIGWGAAEPSVVVVSRGIGAAAVEGRFAVESGLA